MNKGFSLVTKNGIPLISVDCINNTGLFKAYYATGHGGVSQLEDGCSMNLNVFKNNDRAENSRQNFAIFASAAGVPNGSADFVLQHECHSSNAVFVTQKDRKSDIFEKTAYPKGADSQLTAEKLPLFVYASDCPTIMVCDTASGVYGTIHCGWKNCLNGTIQNWFCLFKEKSGNAHTAICTVGPAMCQDCFEVDDDVRELFLNYDESYAQFMYHKGAKTHIDLAAVIKKQLVQQGVAEDSIYLSGICNKCHTQYALPSYRRSKGANGVSGGVMWKV